eukprot:jgi/Bigna1/72513/fgenesh1_pg.20_\
MADGSSRAKRRRKALLFALGIFILGRIFSDNSRVCSNDRLRRRAPTPPGGVYVNVSISRQEPLRISPEEVKRINTMPADKAFCYIHQVVAAPVEDMKKKKEEEEEEEEEG